MKRLGKLIASVFLATSVLALNPIGASAEWKQNSTGWWYAEGDSYVTGWKLIDGNWYYFYSDGYMAKNTTIDGYYLSSSGAWTNSISNNTQTLTIINEIINLTKNEVVNLLGANYECVGVGAEGSWEGYHYKDIGITIVFDYGENSNKIRCITCDDNVDINGAKEGMNFEQIQKQLGTGNMKDYDTIVDAYKAHIYELNYIIQDCKIVFDSFNKDGKNSKLRIVHK